MYRHTLLFVCVGGFFYRKEEGGGRDIRSLYPHMVSAFPKFLDADVRPYLQRIGATTADEN